MNSSPALTQKQYEMRLQAVMLCGKNMGPHDYMPISWVRDEKTEHVTHLMCRVCFVRLNMKTLYNEFPEVSI